MKRRTFLESAAAIPVAVAVPVGLPPSSAASVAGASATPVRMGNFTQIFCSPGDFLDDDPDPDFEVSDCEDLDDCCTEGEIFEWKP